MYDLIVPSTGATIKFRPFTVREQKLLLIAQQSDDTKIMVSTLKEIIEVCTNGKLEVEKLAIFDLEYIMAKLRSKSVGETVKLEFQCDNDSSHPAISVDLDISKIEVTKNPDHNKMIPLFDNVGVMMKYPDISMFDTLNQTEDNPNVIFGIIYDCIDYIYDDKEIFKSEDQSTSDLSEFIDGLTKEQFLKIEMFFATMPKFKHTIEYVCPTCNHEHKKNVEGFSNFF